MDLAPNHCGVLDRPWAALCAVDSTRGEASAQRLISTLEKLTGYSTNVPFGMIRWLRAHQEGDSAHPLFTHFPHTYQLDRQIRLLSEISTIQKGDKLLGSTHSILDVFLCDTALSQLFFKPC